ncbi:hypothetical protein NL676_028284 [Syzygium grande]|nr:hypothetical protein NL676_028284 [Syzygium grande]
MACGGGSGQFESLGNRQREAREAGLGYEADGSHEAVPGCFKALARQCEAGSAAWLRLSPCSRKEEEAGQLWAARVPQICRLRRRDADVPQRRSEVAA